MVNCNLSRTLVDTESKLGSEGVHVQDPTLYHSLVGGLKATFASLKHILRYVQGTFDFGLHLYASVTTSLVDCTDVDWAGCPSTRSAEAKYQGVANVVAETAWLHILLRELHSPLSTATLVYCDNVSAIYMSWPGTVVRCVEIIGALSRDHCAVIIICRVMSTPDYVVQRTITQVMEIRAPEVLVPLPDDPIGSGRQAILHRIPPHHYILDSPTYSGYHLLELRSTVDERSEGRGPGLEGKEPELSLNILTYAPPVVPVQTQPSPKWSFGSFPVSPSSPLVPSPTVSPVATPTVTISVNEDQFLEVGAQLELHESILHDHTQRLEALPPTLFEGIDRDLRDLYTRSGAVRNDFSQRYMFRSLEQEQERATVTFNLINDNVDGDNIYAHHIDDDNVDGDNMNVDGINDDNVDDDTVNVDRVSDTNVDVEGGVHGGHVSVDNDDIDDINLESTRNDDGIGEINTNNVNVDNPNANANHKRGCKRFISYEGFADLTHLSTRIKEHEVGLEHIINMANWFDMRRRVKKNEAIDNVVHEQFEKERYHWMKVHLRIISIVKFLAKYNLAFRGTTEKLHVDSNGNFLGLIEMLEEFDPFIKEYVCRITSDEIHVHYLGHSIQNELIQLLARGIKSQIIQKIKQVKYFSVILDCTPDTSHQEQMYLILSYVNVGSTCVTVEESFLGFLSVDDTTGQGLFDDTHDELKSLDLDIDDVRGQGYDNGSNMKGKHRGVQKKF
ncbi:zinc finger MYM-type protein 1-like protein [Tanacetum coccineum]